MFAKQRKIFLVLPLPGFTYIFSFFLASYVSHPDLTGTNSNSYYTIHRVPKNDEVRIFSVYTLHILLFIFTRKRTKGETNERVIRYETADRPTTTKGRTNRITTILIYPIEQESKESFHFILNSFAINYEGTRKKTIFISKFPFAHINLHFTHTRTDTNKNPTNYCNAIPPIPKNSDVYPLLFCLNRINIQRQDDEEKDSLHAYPSFYHIYMVFTKLFKISVLSKFKCKF